MSELQNLEADVEVVVKLIEGVPAKVETIWESSPLGALVDAEAKKAIAAIESLSVTQAEQAGLTIGEAALQGLAVGGAAGAFAAGVAAAPAALKAAENNITAGAMNTIVTAVVNDIQAQKAAAPAVAATPAA